MSERSGPERGKDAKGRQLISIIIYLVTSLSGMLFHVLVLTPANLLRVKVIHVYPFPHVIYQFHLHSFIIGRLSHIVGVIEHLLSSSGPSRARFGTSQTR